LLHADTPFKWQGSKGWEPESAYCRLYDSKTVVTLQGTVERVEKAAPIKGMGPGIHLILKTDTETIPVQLGPSWYVDQLGIVFQAKDSVEVTGSRVPCEGKPVILAAEITRNDEVAKFRELKGRPLWAKGPTR